VGRESQSAACWRPMGCGGSKDAEPLTEAEEPVEEEEKKHDPYSMEAVRQKQKEKEESGEMEKRGITFKRKFKGFKAGGGSKHDINRTGQASDEDKQAIADRQAAKAAKKAAAAAKEAAGGRSFTRSITRSITRQMTIGRSMTNMFRRGMSRRNVKRSQSGDVPKTVPVDEPEEEDNKEETTTTETTGEEKSKKHAQISLEA